MDAFHFDEIIKVVKVDADGKKYDKVSLIEAESNDGETSFQLDINSELYPMKRKELYRMVISTTLHMDGSTVASYPPEKRELIDVDTFEDAQNDEGFFHQNAHHTSQSMTRPSKSTKSNSTMSATQGQRSAAQGLGYASPSANRFILSTQKTGASSEILGNTHGMQMVKKQSLVHDKEHVRAEITRSPSTSHAIPSYQKTRSLEIPGNTQEMRISNRWFTIKSMRKLMFLVLLLLVKLCYPIKQLRVQRFLERYKSFEEVISAKKLLHLKLAKS